MIALSKRNPLLRRFSVVSVALAAASITLFPALVKAQDSLILDTTGRVGIGTETPARQLHVVGRNAVFRMDRRNVSMLLRQSAADISVARMARPGRLRAWRAG
jgi:hypothetical protein